MNIHIASMALMGLALATSGTAYAGNAPQSSSPKPPSSAEVQQAQAIMKFNAKPTFRDAAGHAISEAAFNTATKAGQRYTAKPDMQTKTFVLTLLPPGVDAPGSRVVTTLATAPVPRPGTRLADFNLPKVGGGHIDTTSFKSKSYIVDFFFADCVGCIAELPTLNSFHRQYPRQRLVAVTFDNAKVAANFVQKRHFDWPVVYAGMAYDNALGIKVYPTMVLVGPDGKVLATRVGADSGVTPAKLEQWVADGLHHAHAQPATL